MIVENSNVTSLYVYRSDSVQSCQVIISATVLLPLLLLHLLFLLLICISSSFTSNFPFTIIHILSLFTTRRTFDHIYICPSFPIYIPWRISSTDRSSHLMRMIEFQYLLLKKKKIEATTTRKIFAILSDFWITFKIF